MRKFLKSIILLLTAVSLIATPCWATRVERGDKVFAGKITFEQDVVAKKDFTVEGSISGLEYSNRYYVSSVYGADVPHYGKTWDKPFATLEYAINKCTANNGDIIYLLPNHALSITADSGVDLDVAGISVIGLGSGDDRPTFTFTTAATADFKIAAANIRVYNCVFVCNITGHDMMIEVGGDDAEIGWCEFREGTQTNEFAVQVGAADDNDADRCWIHDCKFYEPTAGNGDAAISVYKDMTGLKIERCVIYGDYDLAGIDITTTGNAQVDTLISDCVITNLLTGQHAIQVNGTGSTGKIVNCSLESDAIATSIDAGGLEMFNVLWSDGTDQQVAGTPVLSVSGTGGPLLVLDGATQVYPESAADDSIIAKILTKSDPADVSDYDNSTDSLEAIADAVISIDAQINVTEATGEADIDISEADYTGYINIMTVTAPAGGLMDLRIDLDVNKATTGWDTISTAADTIDITLVGQVDGTNYRTMQNATQITANGDGSLENNESGVSFHVGPLGPNESLQVHVKLSVERDDAELPYRVSYTGAAPTITPVAIP